MPSSEVWLPIATLVLGIMLGYVADWLRERRSTKREREERWKAFQRETILEAQDLVGNLYKRAHEYSIGNERPPEEDWGDWPPFLEVSESLYSGMIRLNTLGARIEDSELSSGLDDVYHLLLSEEREVLEDKLPAATQKFNKLVRLILPNLY